MFVPFLNRILLTSIGYNLKTEIFLEISLVEYKHFLQQFVSYLICTFLTFIGKKLLLSMLRTEIRYTGTRFSELKTNFIDQH